MWVGWGGEGGRGALLNDTGHIKLHVVPATTFHANDNTVLVTKRVALQDDLNRRSEGDEARCFGCGISSRHAAGRLCLLADPVVHGRVLNTIQ